MDIKKKINAVFFKTPAGREPVKEVLKDLGRPTKTVAGEDIRFVELNWRIDRPYVDRLRSGSGAYEKSVYEVRHTIETLEYRTLFFVYDNLMVLVHIFHKTTRKTPKSELDLAWKRMKEWVHEQRSIEAATKATRRKK